MYAQGGVCVHTGRSGCGGGGSSAGGAAEAGLATGPRQDAGGPGARARWPNPSWSNHHGIAIISPSTLVLTIAPRAHAHAPTHPHTHPRTPPTNAGVRHVMHARPLACKQASMNWQASRSHRSSCCVKSRTTRACGLVCGLVCALVCAHVLVCACPRLPAHLPGDEGPLRRQPSDPPRCICHHWLCVSVDPAAPGRYTKLSILCGFGASEQGACVCFRACAVCLRVCVRVPYLPACPSFRLRGLC